MAKQRQLTPLAVAIALLIGMVIGGCGSLSPDPTAVPDNTPTAFGDCLGIDSSTGPIGQIAIIYGWRANTQTIPLAQLECAYSSLVDRESTSHLKLVVPRGSAPLSPPSTTIPVKKGYEDPAGPVWDETREWLLTLPLGDQETDSLQALFSAAAVFTEQEQRRKVLVIADSLLSTQGTINFASGNLNQLLYEDGVDNPEGFLTDDILGSIQKLKEDLSSVEIVLLSVGKTAAPQPNMLGQAETSLRSFWIDVLKKGMNANSVVEPVQPIETFCNMPAPNEDGTVPLNPCATEVMPSLPTVSRVYIPVRVTPERDENECYFSAPLDVGSLRFIGNSQVEFTDGGIQARRIVHKIGLELMVFADCGARVRITGTSANAYGPKPTAKQIAAERKWSEGRAVTVRNMLVEELGPDSHLDIEVCGVGFDHPGHINEYPNGRTTQDPYLAEQNMKVIIEALSPTDTSTCT